jgi:hypothetical protein
MVPSSPYANILKSNPGVVGENWSCWRNRQPKSPEECVFGVLLELEGLEFRMQVSFVGHELEILGLGRQVWHHTQSMMDGDLGKDCGVGCNISIGGGKKMTSDQISNHLLTVMPRPELSQEQVSLLSSQEYQHLESTYSSLVKSIKLAPNDQLSLTTLEGVSYTINVTREGWKVLQGGQPSDRERTWEMPRGSLAHCEQPVQTRMGYDVT